MSPGNHWDWLEPPLLVTLLLQLPLHSEKSLLLTSVNKGKKKGRGVKAPAPCFPLLDRPYLSCPPGSFPAGFVAGVASFCFSPPPLQLGCCPLGQLAATVLTGRWLRWRNLGERRSSTAKGHRQRQHQRREQQRNALAHICCFLLHLSMSTTRSHSSAIMCVRKP
jgi:hypothetical protein